MNWKVLGNLISSGILGLLIGHGAEAWKIEVAALCTVSWILASAVRTTDGKGESS